MATPIVPVVTAAMIVFHRSRYSRRSRRYTITSRAPGSLTSTGKPLKRGFGQLRRRAAVSEVPECFSSDEEIRVDSVALDICIMSDLLATAHSLGGSARQRSAVFCRGPQNARAALNGPIIIKVENRGIGEQRAATWRAQRDMPMSEDRLSAPCPRCHTEMS